MIGNHWREVYSIPILNVCNAALCPTDTIIDCNRLRLRGLIMKKCRNKKKIRRIIPKFSPLETNIFEHCPEKNTNQNLKKMDFVMEGS
ncbi:unnamed protein product [Litomosoides sigmodontis]|uniref:Uncharacterized protein n=1 Tax=Litomosoides sigmodontis TaxID=42156 RepID=A0A3P6TJ40_LITSI|nr:unnamed protein product [Litomosoides sigmodontis]